MGLCRDAFNLSVVVKELKDDQYIVVNKRTNRIEGLIGSKLDRLLDNAENK